MSFLEKPEAFREKMRDDIDDLQALSTPELFRYGYDKFRSEKSFRSHQHPNLVIKGIRA